MKIIRGLLFNYFLPQGGSFLESHFSWDYSLESCLAAALIMKYMIILLTQLIGTKMIESALKSQKFKKLILYFKKVQ